LTFFRVIMVRHPILYITAAAVVLFIVSFPSTALSQSERKYWVYFTDKGPYLPADGILVKNSFSYKKALGCVSPLSLARRSKVLSPDSLVDAADLPLYEPYIQTVTRFGGVLAQKSRWLNAASFILASRQLTLVGQLEFVSKVIPVVAFRGLRKESKSEHSPPALQKSTSLDYGQSLHQLQMINIPALHISGITGDGVLIGMLDSGFRWRTHEALQTRNVINEHDFIFHRDVTANQANDAPNQDTHGTLTFSVIGGYAPGKLIGAAFTSGFVLAKTEYIPSETRVEEDNWAAAIEWMDSLGVDIASSSLGYDTFDPPDSGYTWEHGDFNGRTSITAKAALRAARLGIVVCTAMGNELNGDGVRGTMLTPADADSIISVGAVDFSYRLAYFSSTGPTNDGRIKPDVVAPGVGIYYAAVPGPDTYSYSQGTSLATPLAAGSAALLLSARPELTPLEVRDALRSSADPADLDSHPLHPNNFTGWGLVNAFNAVLAFGPVFSNKPSVNAIDSKSTVSTIVISRKGLKPESLILHYAAGADTQFTAIQMMLDSVMYFTTSGRYKVTIPPLPLGTRVRFYIEASDSSGNLYQSPPPIRRSTWQIKYGIGGLGPPGSLPTAYELLQNYPNPFNSKTNITYNLSQRDRVTIKIYNVLGQYVATLADEIQEGGDASSRPPAVFDAGNLPSGVYFYRLTTPSFNAVRKMLIIR